MVPTRLAHAAAAITLACILASSATAQAAPSRVARENLRHGDSGWVPRDHNGTLEGYVSDEVVAPGATLDFHVSAPSSYQLVIERLGWYGGQGGRRIGCVPDCATWLNPGRRFDPPIPPEGTVRAPTWPVTAQLHVGPHWPSGLYEALIVPADPADGPPGTIFFSVGPDRTRPPAQALVVLPFTTWQAYNNYSGRSLYGFNSTDGKAAVRVSMNRPLADNQFDWFSWDYPLIRFLERVGIDVAYTSDVDVDRNPQQLLGHRLVIVSGHSEYWSKDIRDGFEAARDAGVDLWFMGADDGQWQIRYEDDHRTVVEYRGTGDPVTDATTTREFRYLDPPRPECQLLGVGYLGGFQNPPGQRDYQVAPGASTDPWLAGTGLAEGQSLPGLVGFEWDGVEPGCDQPGRTVLFTAPADGDQPEADAVKYVTPSGSTVFSTGSLQFVWALDGWARPSVPHWGPPVPGIRRMMRNALASVVDVPKPCAGRTPPRRPGGRCGRCPHPPRG